MIGRMIGRRAAFIVTALVSAALVGCVTVSDQEIWEPQARAEVHVLLGMNYLRRGQFDIAQEEFDLALDIDTRSDRAYHGRGLLLAQLDQPREALVMLEKAVELNPNNYIASNDLGILLCQSAVSANTRPLPTWSTLVERVSSGQDVVWLVPAKYDPEDRLRIERGMDVLMGNMNDPENNQVLATRLGLGLCSQNLGMLEEAKIHFSFVLKAQPNLPQALLAMSEIAYWQKQYLKARGFAERYFSIIATPSIKALSIAALTELQLGDVNSAKKYWERLSAGGDEQLYAANTAKILSRSAIRPKKTYR